MSQRAFRAEIVKKRFCLLEQVVIEFGLADQFNEALLHLGFREQIEPPRAIAFERSLDNLILGLPPHGSRALGSSCAR